MHTGAEKLIYRLPEQAADKLPDPQLRLFLSIDVVGSTAFKQRTLAAPLNGEDNAQPWLHTLTGFYTTVHDYLNAEWDALPDRMRRGVDDTTFVGRPPRFWKALGDEAVYYIDIDDPRQVALGLVVFVRVIQRQQRELRGRHAGLNAKGTAWLAGFPVTNSEIVFGERDDDLLDCIEGNDDWFIRHFVRRHLHAAMPSPAESLDFLGPQIDLGFRLASRSSPRRMTLSLDLAHMVATVSPEVAAMVDSGHQDEFSLHERIFFDESTALKGVMAGVPYPRFWLDVRPDARLNSAEDHIRLRRPVSTGNVREFCEAFIGHHSKMHPWLTLPFVCGRGNKGYGEPSAYHRTRFAEMTKEWQEAFAKWKSERLSGDDAAPPEAAVTIDGERSVKSGEDVRGKVDAQLRTLASRARGEDVGGGDGG